MIGWFMSGLELSSLPCMYTCTLRKHQPVHAAAAWPDARTCNAKHVVRLPFPSFASAECTPCSSSHLCVLTPLPTGSCWAPTSVNASIWLTHWGRMELDHRSHSAYLGDNYSEDTQCAATQPDGWLKFIKGHPCYNPEKVRQQPGMGFARLLGWADAQC